MVVDSMHAADLGTFADALGSLMWLEISCKQWYRNQAVGLEALNCELKKYYVANKHKNLSRVTPLVRSQIIATEPGDNFLKAKAAQTRHLAEFGLILASVHKFGCDGREPFRFKESSALAPHIGRHLDLLVDMFLGMVRYLRALAAETFAVQECRQGMYLYRYHY